MSQGKMKYNYPMFDVPETCRVINSTFPDLTLTEEDFKHPQPDRFQIVFATFMEHLVGVGPDQLNQIDLNVPYQPEHLELHEEAIATFTFGRALWRLCYAAGITDFTLRDLIEPKPKRMLKILCALVNFTNFATERMAVYDRLEQENNSRQENVNLIKNENKDLRAKCNTIKETRAEQIPEMQQYEEKIDGVKSMVEDLRSQSLEKSKAISDLKLNNSEIKTQIATAKNKIIDARAVGEKLSKEIVQSPDRMKLEMEKMHGTLKQRKVAKEERLGRQMEVQQQLTVLSKHLGDSEPLFKLMSSMQGLLDKERAVLDHIRQTRENFTEGKEQLRVLDMQEQTLKRQISSKQEKLSKLNLQYNNMVASLKDNIQQLNKECGENKQDDQIAVIQMNLNKIQEVERKAAQNHQRILDELKTKYVKLLEKLDEYNNRLCVSWLKAREALDASSEKAANERKGQ